MITMNINTPAYHAIAAFYHTRTTARSKVPLINHIDEGLLILQYIGASAVAWDAYCLHPLVQDDEALLNNLSYLVHHMDSETLLYAMEYRNVANAYLREAVMGGAVIRLSPLPQVNMMLVADKVQNRKDFETYHKGKHPHSDDLVEYFRRWLEVLNVDEDMYNALCKHIDDNRDHSSSS